MCKQRTKLSYQMRLRSCSKFNRLSLSTTLILSVCVDKSYTMSLYNKLGIIQKLKLDALCKKIDMIFTGLSFSGTTKIQRYL